MVFGNKNNNKPISHISIAISSILQIRVDREGSAMGRFDSKRFSCEEIEVFGYISHMSKIYAHIERY